MFINKQLMVLREEIKLVDKIAFKYCFSKSWWELKDIRIMWKFVRLERNTIVIVVAIEPADDKETPIMVN